MFDWFYLKFPFRSFNDRVSVGTLILILDPDDEEMTKYLF